MSKPVQTLAAALAFALLAPAAWAVENDHADNQKAPSGTMPQMDHGQMSHGQMDHSQMPGMDHSQMQNMDHGKMDHGAMHQAQDAKPEAESKDDR